METMICDACHQNFHVHIVIPSEAWETICRGEYAMCAQCMSDRLHEQGMKVEGEAQFSGRGLFLKRTPMVEASGAHWRASQNEIDRHGPVGNPKIYGR